MRSWEGETTELVERCGCYLLLLWGLLWKSN
jgi:hypothetical protein